MGKETAVSSVTAVRPQIKNMLSPGTDEEFVKGLSESGAVAGDEKAPRKRRSKEEMAAARGEKPATAPQVDPLMEDPRYAQIMADMTSGGGKEIVAMAFRLSDKPLTKQEDKKIDDMFYVLAKRSQWNPANSPWALGIAFFVTIALMVIDRTPIVAKIRELFEQPMKMADPPKKEEVKGVPAVAEVLESSFMGMQ